MPPAPTGVAGYSAALIRALHRHAPEIAAKLRLNPRDACDLDFYHAGNNHLHREIYRRALHQPGIVVLHDAVLHHFFLGIGGSAQYVDEFVYNYGEWLRGEAERLWRRRSQSAQDPAYFRWAMLRRLGDRSKLVLVHNAAAETLVRQHAPMAQVRVIPHLFEAPAPVEDWEWLRLRSEHGLNGAVLVGVLGYLRESKRVIPLIDAVARLRRSGLDLRLLVAGRWASDELARAAADRLRQPWVLRLPYLSERSFWLWAHALDVCVNLRYPAAGETSGIAIRLMGIGRPVVMTAGEETAALPAGCCIRIDGGLAEADMLEAALLWLARNPVAARQIGEAARRWIAQEHSPARVVRKLRDLIPAALS
jgi:glycosyltransferase involved in cell wall biosynthesis